LGTPAEVTSKESFLQYFLRADLPDIPGGIQSVATQADACSYLKARSFIKVQYIAKVPF
jgi:hypothetical protein